jgi:GTPase SAR1 family protein
VTGNIEVGKSTLIKRYIGGEALKIEVSQKLVAKTDHVQEQFMKKV